MKNKTDTYKFTRKDLNKIFRSKLSYFAIFLIAFGTLNLSLSVFAAENQTNDTQPGTDNVWDSLFGTALAQVVPMVGGIVTIGIQFARQHGLKISAEAEEYFVNSAKSFVSNQSRFLYNEIKSNPEYQYALSKGIVPKALGEKARDNVMQQLKVELRSNEFTKNTREMLDKNLETLVERFVTEDNKELVEKTNKIFHALIPTAVNAVLLQYETTDEAKKDKDKIIKDVLDSVEKHFDYEDMLFSDDIAMMHIKSELNKKIGHIK